MRRLVLILGLALLCLVPVIGVMVQPNDLSARPLSAETAPLTLPDGDQSEP